MADDDVSPIADAVARTKAWETQMSIERKRLWEILRVVAYWGGMFGPLNCPICGVLIVYTQNGRSSTPSTLRQRHIEWHLRCLQ